MRQENICKDCGTNYSILEIICPACGSIKVEELEGFILKEEEGEL